MNKENASKLWKMTNQDKLLLKITLTAIFFWSIRFRTYWSDNKYIKLIQN